MSTIVGYRGVNGEGDEPHPVPETAQSGMGDGFTVAIPLHMAKCQLGGAMQKAINKTDSTLKEFGTPQVVERMCKGELSDVLGRIWARPDTREEFLLALLKASGLFSIETQIKRRA
jgi:hypothetical protein